jgi:uncharacterized protein YaeQ
MALSSTMYAVNIALAHVDRGVYETLDFRMAMHPSESPEYFVARLLAYCLEYAEGMTFSKGVSDADEPTLSVRDLTGTITTWIEIGPADAARLHKASKAAPRVVVFNHKEPRVWLSQLATAKIHRAERLELWALPRELIDALVEKLDRRLRAEVSVTDGTVYVNVGGDTLTGTLERLSLG